MKNKKKVGIIIGCIVLLILVGVGIYFITRSGKNNSENMKTKAQLLYETIQKEENYQWEQKLDENNYSKICMQGNKAYKEEVLEGQKNVYLVKDHNTYYLQEEEKKYYTYENNEDILSEIVLSLEDFISLTPTKGKEKLNSKTYEYEEYEGVIPFSKKGINQEAKNKKTRFYFEGNDLKYIKTIVGESQELLEIKFSNQTEENKFEIPSDYQAQ